MNYRHILLALFLFLLVLSVESVSAENVTAIDDADLDGIHEDLIEEPTDKLSVCDHDMISEQSSDPLPNIETGTVSGGVDFINKHPWADSDPNGNRGNITYEIPKNAKIKSAYVYVNIYSGSGGTNYGAYANTSITTKNGENQLGCEYLWTSSSSLNGINYIVNDHTTRCYSDYMIFYNVTDMLQGLNESAISIDVVSYPMAGKSFDGRIKLVSLFVAWDDEDNDVINYWLNAGQAWTDTKIGHSWDLSEVNLDDVNATLINAAISSADAVYYINDEPLFSENDEDVYINGAYYQYHKWDITNYLDKTFNFQYKAVSGAYGPSFKTAVSILTIKQPTLDEAIQANVSVKVADYSKNIVYPGFTNPLNVSITTNHEGRYDIVLTADGVIVDSKQVNLIKGENIFTLIDSTIREFNDSSIYTGESESYETINYNVQVSYLKNLVNQSSIEAKVLYNGYLSKETYNETSLQQFNKATVSGDIVILTSGTYADGNEKYPLVNFTVELPNNSKIVKAFIYVTYCWAKDGKDNIDMFNVTLNDNKLTPIFFARDQSNLESLDGYGVVVYDASNHLVNGNNLFDLYKNIDSVAVYPTTLIYMFNTTGSNIAKVIYISNGADLLGDYGGIKDSIQVDSTINVDSKGIANAIAYIFANGAIDGRGTVVINGESEAHPWNGNSKSTDLYIKDITRTIKDSNEISVRLTSGGFTVLQQIIVTSKIVPMPTKITADSRVTTVYNTNKNLIVKLTDVNGKPVSGAKLTVVLNGNKKVITTGSDGKAAYAIPSNLVPKIYDVSIAYAGDDSHIKSSLSTTKVIVNKAKVKLVAKAKVTFKVKAKSKKYTVTLKDNKGKAINNAKVSLKIKKKTYKATTNAKGKATFKITKLTKKGKYTAVIKFAGNSAYKAATKKVKITVKK